MTTLSLPLARNAAPAAVTIDDDTNTHGVYDQHGNPTEPEELARLSIPICPGTFTRDCSG